MRSLQTAQTIRRLAGEIGVQRLGVVINKVPDGLDVDRLIPHLDGLPLLGTLSLDPEVARADLEGKSPYTGVSPQCGQVDAILEAVLG